MNNDILLKVQRPSRYIGGEVGSVMKNKENIDVRFAFCFPDTYEIGMSHLGMKILYNTINSLDYAWCERVFAPAEDMENVLRAEKRKLFALESGDSLDEFDIIGFTLQYELSYTNILNMLDLGNVEIFAKNRKSLKNIVIAGGPCACNPEPLADFIDVFALGDGEELDNEIIDVYRFCKLNNLSKDEFLQRVSKIKGVYVPSLYNVEYNTDNTVKSVTPIGDAYSKVEKRVIGNLDNTPYPDKFIVPFVETVFDRAVIEIFRGCIRGCRFCQAGYIYRPVREKSAMVANKQAKCICDFMGAEQLSLLSLSTSDYTQLEPLLNMLLEWTDKEKISLSLPSLRIDNFSGELLEKIASVRKSGLTFAPEAGTQRLRDAINKNITEEEILSACKTAFLGGYTTVKLYFMMGLPTETDEDIEGIALLAKKIVKLYYSLDIPPENKQKGVVQVSVSCATFVPKPFTPFEFEGQNTVEQIEHKQQYLKELIGNSKRIKIATHQPYASVIEAVLAKGDRRVAKAIYEAFKLGCKFDSWSEYFDYEKWLCAFKNANLDIDFYASRKRQFDEVMPWDHLDYGITKEFLIRENKLAYQSTTTPNCRQKCALCGANCYKEGVCVEKRENIL